MKNIEIGYVKNILEQDKVENVKLKNALAMIATPIDDNKYSSPVTKNIIEIRKLTNEINFTGGNDALKKRKSDLKKSLPAFLFSGKFNTSKQLIKHSGIFLADIDHIPPELFINGYNVFKGNEHVIFCFASTSGDGLKVGFRIKNEINTPEEHRNLYESFADYFREKFPDYKLDNSGKNVNRLCFISHDADNIYVNYDAVPLELIPKIKNKDKRDYDIPKDAKLEDVRKACMFLKKIKLEYDEWVKCGMALADLGEIGRDFWLYLSDNDFYNDTDRDINLKFDDFLKSTKEVKIASLFAVAGKHGYSNDFEFYEMNIRDVNTDIEEANKLEMPRQLFGRFIYEHQLGIMFARTSVGKSTLAWQICESIASGSKTKLNLDTIEDGMPVVYIDLETDLYTIKFKYGNSNYKFSKNFYRFDYSDFEDFCYSRRKPYDPTTSNAIIKFMERTIIATGAKFIVLDNISVFSSIDQQKAKDATMLINELNRFKVQYDVTILILAHTPKLPKGVFIEKEHLAGSAAFSTLIQFLFAINESEMTKARYLKQLKQRLGGISYNKVLVAEYTTNPYPQLEYSKFDDEENHVAIVKLTSNDKEILRLIRENNGSISALELQERSEHFKDLSRKAAENALMRLSKKLPDMFKEDKRYYYYG